MDDIVDRLCLGDNRVTKDGQAMLTSGKQQREIKGLLIYHNLVDDMVLQSPDAAFDVGIRFEPDSRSACNAPIELDQAAADVVVVFRDRTGTGMPSTSRDRQLRISVT